MSAQPLRLGTLLREPLRHSVVSTKSETAGAGALSWKDSEYRSIANPDWMVEDEARVIFTHDFLGGVDKVDTEHYTEEEIDRLFEAAKREAGKFLTPDRPIRRKFMALPYNDRALLHRILTGIAITDNVALLTKASSFDRSVYMLATYMDLVLSQNAVSQFIDIVGAVRSRKLALALGMAKKNLHDFAYAYTALNGNTNPNEKWVPAYMERLGAKGDALAHRYFDIVGRPTVTDAQKTLVIVDQFEFADDVLEAWPLFVSPDLHTRATEAFSRSWKNLQKQSSLASSSMMTPFLNSLYSRFLQQPARPSSAFIQD